MKGVIFNVVQEAVEAEFGADTWDAILDKAGVTGAYTSLGNYEDAQLVAIVGAAAAALGKDVPATLRWVGERAFTPLAARHPAYLEGHTGLKSFLPALNSIIHPEVLKLYPDSIVPQFDLETLDDDHIAMVYRSPRALPDLAVGLALGAARHFGETWEAETHNVDGGTRIVLRR